MKILVVFIVGYEIKVSFASVSGLCVFEFLCVLLNLTVCFVQLDVCVCVCVCVCVIVVVV